MKSHHKSSTTFTVIFLLSILLLTSVCLPLCAFAEEVTWTADWTVTISLQGSPANIPDFAPTSSKTFGTPMTGDSLLLLMVAVLALIAAVSFFLCVRFKFAGNSGSSVVSKQTSSAKRTVTFLAIVAVVVAALSFSMFGLNTAHALAHQGNSYFTGKSTVQVDEQGKILQSDIDFTNNSGSHVTIIEVQAPEDLKGWNVQLSETVLDSGDHITGVWDAGKLSEEVLSKLKENGGELVLTGKATVVCDVEESQYTVEHYTENIDGTYSEDPVETVTEYGVEGELTQAKALELKGFTAQNFAQTTINADGTTVVSIKYARNSYKLEFDGNGHEIDIAQQTVKFGERVTKPANPTAGVLVFDGWFTDAACTAAFDFENATMPASDVKLYAKWSQAPIDFEKATVDTSDKLTIHRR